MGLASARVSPDSDMPSEGAAKAGATASAAGRTRLAFHTNPPRTYGITVPELF